MYFVPCEITISDFNRKIPTCTKIRTSDLEISSLVLYHLSYPGSMDGTNTIDSSNGEELGWRPGAPSFEPRPRFEFFLEI